MPFITKPQQLNEVIELFDVQGWDFHHTTGVLLVQGRENAIIETGSTRCGAQILTKLAKRSISLDDVRYVCVTHRHGDHCGGATPLAVKLPNTIVAGHKYAIATLHDPEPLNVGARQLFGKFAQDILPLPSEIATQELQDGDLIDLGKGVEIEVVGTPGHTSDHLAYLERKTQTLYTGDAGGLLGPQNFTVIPTSFPPSFKFDVYRASLEKLQALNPATLVFSHFGAVVGNDVSLIFHRALETLDSWRATVEEAWEREPTQKAIINTVRKRFLSELEVFPPEARPLFIEVMARGFTRSLFPNAQ